MKTPVVMLILVIAPFFSHASAVSPLTGNWIQQTSPGAGRDCDEVKNRVCGWSSVARKNEVHFTGSKFTRQVTGFSDSKRQSPQWTKQVSGTFRSSKSSASGVSNLDIDFQSVQLTALSPEQAALWNRINFCGRKNWELRIQQNVTGQTCDPLPMRVPGSTYYTAVSLEGSKLFFAEDSDEKDGSSPASRPTNPNTANPWIRN